MNNLLIALNKIAQITHWTPSRENVSKINFQINELATEAINSFKEERSYSDEQLFGFAEYSNRKSNYWYNELKGRWYRTDDYEDYKSITTSQLFDKYIQSLSPLKEATGY